MWMELLLGAEKVEQLRFLRRVVKMLIIQGYGILTATLLVDMYALLHGT